MASKGSRCAGGSGQPSFRGSPPAEFVARTAGLATTPRHRSGGSDVQIAGIGSDGHIAFNEPGSALTSTTRLKTLNARTRADNARFFASADEVPRHVITQGLGTILRHRHLLLLATGPSKAAAAARAVEGPLAASFPASVVQLHPHTTVLLDSAAGSALKKYAEYYAEVWASRPEWQPL